MGGGWGLGGGGEKTRTRKYLTSQQSSHLRLVVSVVFIRMSHLTKMSEQMLRVKCARNVWHANQRVRVRHVTRDAAPASVQLLNSQSVSQHRAAGLVVVNLLVKLIV